MEAGPSAREEHVPVPGAGLFLREIGEGETLIVLHGGPDFDHSYLLPELDVLARSLRLVYYDQRGRGRSAEGVRAQDVAIASEIDDLDAVRRHLGLEQVAVLGHSWGGLLAAEYATRRPGRVSRLVLLNSAPLSHAGLLLLREHLRRVRPPADQEALRALSASEAYRRGDVDAEVRYHRVHFAAGVRSPEHLDEIVGRLRRHFTPETILLAREIEGRLYEQTWRSPDYDLLPALGDLRVPSVVLHGADDLIPVAVAERVAGAIPDSTLAVLPGCGHFSYVERPGEVHRLVAAHVRG